MTRLQVIRYSIWGAAAVLLLVAATLNWTGVGGRDMAPSGGGFGPFTLVADTGEAVTEAAMLGHPTLMFFGFTNCSDVCPTALAEASA